MTFIKAYILVLIIIAIFKIDEKMKVVDKRNASDPIYQAKQWQKALSIVFKED